MLHSFSPTPENMIAPGVHQTPIKGLLYLPHQPHSDNRGFYAELARVPEIEAVTGEPFMIKQLNLSYSEPNVIRGFHSENWNKLLTVIEGECFCAWLDIRRDSPTFGEVVTMTVGKNAPAFFGSVFVSAGIANSFCVTKGPADYLYAVDKLYADRDPSGDRAINVFDPELQVPWPIEQTALIISERDKQAISFQAFKDGHGA